jgi:uroporphyrinogen-III synthase
VVRGASTGADGLAPGSAAGSGREWLMARCRERGARVEACVAYERHAPDWTELQRSDALAATGPDCLWLFSSSEAIEHLHAALPCADWSLAMALCTHDRIARTARAVGFGDVIDSRPALEDVLSALESAQSLS